MTHREKQKCTLEEFFAEDEDVPEFYICSTFTDSIFKMPSLLNGRMYEHADIIHWLKKEGTDPFSREEIDDENNKVQIVMKSTIGLDQYMVKKVNNYGKALRAFVAESSDEDAKVDMANNFALFLCCIVKPKLYEQSDREIQLYSEDHYVIARNFCVGENAFLINFHKNELLYYVMKQAKNNKVVLESVVEFMDQFFDSYGSNSTPKLTLRSPTENETEANSSSKSSNFLLKGDASCDMLSVLDELSGGKMYTVPDGMPPSLASLLAVSQYLLPHLRTTSNEFPVLYHAINIFKRDYRGFLPKSKSRVLVVSHKSVALYKEGGQRDLQSMLARPSGCSIKDLSSICTKNGTGTETKFCEEILFESGVVTANYGRKESGSFTYSRGTSSQIIVADALGKKRWVIEGKRDVIREIAYIIKYLAFISTNI